MRLSRLPWRSHGSRGQAKSVDHASDPLAVLESVDGRVAIAKVLPRAKATVGGVVAAVESSPPGSRQWARARLVDDSGELDLLWHGRTEVPGIDEGTLLAATGTVSTSKKSTRIIEPAYTILKGDTA